MAGATGVADILSKIKEQEGDKDQDNEQVKLGDIVESLEGRGFGPVLLVPALIALLPTGGIPGVPSVIGILIFLISVQMVFGKKYPWLPSWLKNIDFDRDTFSESIDKALPYAKKVDRFLKPRLTALTNDSASRVVAACCAVAGLSMIPLEVIPFAAAIPAASITLAALGLSTKDGLLTLLAGLFFLAVLYFLLQTL